MGCVCGSWCVLQYHCEPLTEQNSYSYRSWFAAFDWLDAEYSVKTSMSTAALVPMWGESIVSLHVPHSPHISYQPKMYFSRPVCKEKKEFQDDDDDEDDTCQTERRESETCRWQSFLFSFMPYDVHRCILLFQDPDRVNEGKGFIMQDETVRKKERGRTTTSSASIFWQTWERTLFWHTGFGIKRGLLCFEDLPVFPNALKGRLLVFNRQTHTHSHTSPRTLAGHVSLC